MKSKMFLLISCSVLLVVVCIIVGVIVWIVSISAESNKDSKTNSDNGSLEDVDVNIDDIDIGSSNVKSIRNDNLTFKKSEKTYVGEMKVAVKTLELLESKGWDGTDADELDLSASDYEKSFLDEVIQKDKERTQNLTIPDDLEDFYISEDATKEIVELIFVIREEYMAYLKERGVSQKYIDEINNNALPKDKSRLQYKPVNDPNVPPSVTQPLSNQEGEKDNSKREFIIYPVDIYNGTVQIKNSGIVDDSDHKLLRDMSLRSLMYHEFTHVLQKAVDTVHSSKPKVQSSWIGTSRSLRLVTDRYNRKWGSDAINDSRNRDVSNESQADGVSYEMMVNIYDMSEIQKELYWEFRFGRLSEAQEDWNKVLSTFENKYPVFWVDTFGDKLYRDVFKSESGELQRTMFILTTRLDAIGPYGGYFNPMKPEHANEFWDYLEE